LTANRDGSLRPQRSAILETWFPGLPAHLTFSEFIAQIDPSRHAWTDLAWEQVTAGVIPLEVAIDQLPQHLVRQGRHFEVEHHPLVQDGALVQVGIVVSDVTAEIERARAAAEQQEFSVLVDQFVRDRRAFGEFWHEAASLVARVTAEEASVASGIKRDLHTLKGNARFYGLARLSSLIHRIEDALAERQGDALLAEERVEIADLWGGLERRMEPITREGASRIEITEAEQQALLRAIAARQPHAAIEKLVRELSHEPTSRRLEWAKAIVLEACQKLGKPVPEVQIDHHDLRLPAERWALFWNTLPHVLRNLADHGIDLEAERVAAGKPAVCTVRLSTAIDRRDLVVKVEDDGRGIDWDRVRDQAAAMSLPHATQADLEAALLHEGLSTRQTTTDLSGRGVGLSAVRAVVESLGGTMALESRAGQGTAWTFRLPMG
jgi:two-component system chemotaxis sensor kinase CheA